MDQQRFDDLARTVSRVSDRRSLLGAVGAGIAGLVLGKRVTSGQSAETGGESPCVNFLFGSGSATGGLDVTFRVRLSAPAPAGGAVVALSRSHLVLLLPPTVTVPAGQTERNFTVATRGVAVNTNVTVTASAGGCTVSRSLLLKAPRLRALHVQSVIRGGGQGKVTVCIHGEAPTGGTAVELTSDTPGVLASPGTVVIPEEKGCLSVIVPAAAVEGDVPVGITAALAGGELSGTTIVRDLEVDPTPTMTATEAPTETPTEVPTSTPTETPTNTATATSTPTETVEICTPVGEACEIGDPGACCSQTCGSANAYDCPPGAAFCCIGR